LEGYRIVFAQLAQDFQTTAATVAPKWVAGVCNVPQLVQDEAWNHQGAFKETSDAEIGDPAINDRTGIHQNVAVP
jgi:hypothetical protein